MSSKSTTIEVKFTGDAKSLKSAADESARAVEDAADDIESAGEQMARALEDSAQKMVREIDETAAAVEAMDAALKAAGSDMNAQDAVADLKKLGLTANEIEADAERLEQGLRAVGDVKVHAQNRGFDDLDKALGSTDTNARAASTAIGGIGNTVSELPGVGALGPMAESMGQLAEGALEGEINVGSLVATAGGLAAVAFVAQNVSKHFEKLAAIKAWKKDEVDDYTDALEGAETTLDGVIEKLRSAGAVEFNLFGGATDINADLAELGMTVEDFAALVEGGKPKIDAWREAMDAAGVSTDAVKVTAFAATQQTELLDKAQEAAKVTAQVFGKEQETSAGKTAKATGAVHDYADALREQLEAQDAATAAVMGAADASLNYRNQQAETTATIAASNLTMLDASKTTAEHEQAARDAEGAVLAQADAAVRLAEEQAAANGQTLSAEEAARIYKSELQSLAGELNGPTRAAIDGHIDALGRIPASIYTNVQVNTRGELPQLQRGARGVGGRVIGGREYEVNEQGLEIFEPDGAGTVLAAGQTAGVMRDEAHRGSAGVTIINYPSGVRPIPVVNAGRSYDRIQGPL